MAVKMMITNKTKYHPHHKEKVVEIVLIKDKIKSLPDKLFRKNQKKKWNIMMNSNNNNSQ